jgi:hypothetical protein
MSEEIIENTAVRYVLLARQKYPECKWVNLCCKVTQIGAATNSPDVGPAWPNTLDRVLHG